VIAPRTKTGKGRAIDLDATTVAELRANRARQAQEFLLLGMRPDGDTLAFGLPDGRPYHPAHFSREFDRAVARIRKAELAANVEHLLPRIRLHDLRHTWATLALEAGVPVKIVSERLGHATSAITNDTYSHVSPTMQADAAERVSALIFQRPS
jgi:integrase